MPTPVEDIAAQALDLPPEDRAKLIERLITSFEPKSPAQALWLQAAKARRDDVQAGRVALVPGDAALARIRGRLSPATGTSSDASLHPPLRPCSAHRPSAQRRVICATARPTAASTATSRSRSLASWCSGAS
jgi:Putative addiction module component